MSAQPSAAWRLPCPPAPYQATHREPARVLVGYTPDPEVDRITEALAAGQRLYQNQIGDAQIDDAILREAARHFPLYEADALKVEEEYGLKPAQQVALGIRSAPHSVARIFAAHAILKRFGDQAGHVAPLYDDGDGLKLHTPTHGLVVPVVRGGLVRAWQHFKTADDRAPRWVSSSHLPKGRKVQPSIHVVGAEHVARSRVCLVVNHTLEAEGVAQGGIVCVVGLNNVSPAALVTQLHVELPSLAGVTLALDEVSPFLTRALMNAGLKWRIA